MTIDSFGPEQSASARRGKKSRANNAAPSYAAQEPLLPQVSVTGSHGWTGLRFAAGHHPKGYGQDLWMSGGGGGRDVNLATRLPGWNRLRDVRGASSASVSLP